MLKKLFCVTVVCFLSFSLFSGGAKEKVSSGQRESAAVIPSEENWDMVYEAAKKEGKVVIYSLSSRIFDAVKEFGKMYPEITIEAIDIPTNQQIEKLTKEQAAGLYNVDVLLLADETTILYDLIKKGLASTYVPADLIDGVKTLDVIEPRYRTPLLLHSIEAKVIFYNADSYKEPPVDNLWDFTRPEWKGKFQMKDPMQANENMNFLQMVVKHSDLMAAAYEKEFGKKLTLSPGIENAGLEWIDRILKNDLVLTSSDGSVSSAVGAPGQTNAPLGLCIASSKIRDNKKGQKLAIAWNVEPKFGIYKGNYLLLANKAPHPNAAKLLIRYMLGDAQGGKGLKSFYVPGQWVARSDVKSLSNTSLEDVTKLSWGLDTDYIYYEGLKVRDFWLSR
ncbi:extracellular solute-binding protein [Treponema sp. HNW]|uniref:ABC transporter substrate-binding protein n=1 Tax=Treponema sp. HNW TaxID=3116654 RepID=UPI003D11CC30